MRGRGLGFSLALGAALMAAALAGCSHLEPPRRQSRARQFGRQR